MFEDLKKNIEQEKKIIEDAKAIFSGIKSNPSSRVFYLSSLSLLMQQLKILNRAVPSLLKEESPLKKLEKEPLKKEVVRMSYVSPSTKEKNIVSLNKKDRNEFLEKLKISEDTLKRIRKEQKTNLKSDAAPFLGSYIKFSNRFFRKFSERISPSFTGIGSDLKKGNTGFLLFSYISMSLMSVLISFVAGIFIFVAFVIFDSSNWTYVWIPFGLAGFVAILFYLYPASEAGSVEKKINQELPFATIHMAAIAGSDIEPTKIFKIISSSKEYPNIGKEINKIITQTEVYGYDLITSLKNVATRTSNKKLGELFSGLATNISTGGELKTYLESKAENFLLDYRLERQKYTDLAGTFMDIYISILITAPLVLMMMFIVMNIIGLGMGGLTMGVLTLFSVVGIAFINIVFLFILNLKQPHV